MGSNPINLALRFVLEIIALIAIGMWGWRQTNESWLRFILAIGLPILFAAIWGIFAVPDDPSRSGSTLVITPGIFRLFIELGIFVFASWTLFQMEFRTAGLVFAAIVIIHYAISYDRIAWLISH